MNVKCVLYGHKLTWAALPGRSLHGTATCVRCGEKRSDCFRSPGGNCTDPQHSERNRT